MAVDEYHYLSRAAAEAPQADAAGRPAGHAVAQDAARGDEKSRNLFRQDGEEGGVVCLFNLPAVNDGYGLCEVSGVGLVACAGHHDLVQRACGGFQGIGFCRLPLCRKEAYGHEGESESFCRHVLFSLIGGAFTACKDNGFFRICGKPDYG